MKFTEQERSVFQNLVLASVLVAAVIGFFYFLWSLRPAAELARAEVKDFLVKPGDGLEEIGARLRAENLIRSEQVFKVFAVARGAASSLKPGSYSLSSASSTPEIVSRLVRGETGEIAVTIPEGYSVFQIDELLSGAGVMPAGSLIRLDVAEGLEGKLFPDSYRFYPNSGAKVVAERMQENFRQRTAAVPGATEEKVLILASLLEKEVPDFEERRMTAGVLLKRLVAGMPLQVDASVCYAKQVRAGRYVPCYPLTAADLELQSSYNTYLNRGLPPGPIANPGLAAIRAAADPKDSEYWFYLSDPLSHRTIFSRTLDEHAQNRVKYLSRPK